MSAVAYFSKHYNSYKNFIENISNNKTLGNIKYKKLIKNKKKNKGGRNNLGRISIKGRSSYYRYLYKNITFNYYTLLQENSLSWKVERLEYDSKRNASIALISTHHFLGLYKNYSERNSFVDFCDKSYAYILSSSSLKVGQILNFIDLNLVLNKNTQWCRLNSAPTGSLFFNAELRPKTKGILARSAGTCCKLLRKYNTTGLVVLPSGKVINISLKNYITLGKVSNIDFKLRKKYKAGNNRWLGYSSKVRGVAKNPVDHPHGGGEGKSSGGRHPVSKQGILAKGFVTVKKKKKKI